MLVIHGSCFPIFLCSNNRYGSDDASLDIIPEGLLYFIPEVVGLFLAFGIAPSLR